MTKPKSTMQFDKDKYKVYTWKSPVLFFFWVLNPFAPFSELIFGHHSFPRITLIDKSSIAQGHRRAFYPCPHCKTLHDARIWSNENVGSNGHWFGFYCRSCGQTIPDLPNVFSYLILAITAPLWWWFKDALKAKWLAKQPQRYANICLEPENLLVSRNWTKASLFWSGFFAFSIIFFSTIIFFPAIGNVKIGLGLILLSLIIGSAAGFAFVYLIKILLKKQLQKESENTSINKPTD